MRDSHAARQRIARATRSVAQHLTNARGEPAWDFKVGTVTATSPLTVAYADGVDLPHVARLASYTPTVNDVVLVLVRSPTATILGKFS